jgi:dUTP pyrophosphatase
LDKDEIVSISTGVYLDIPEDVVAMVCPRSGLAVKHGVTVLNAPGIIDSDYKDEVKVILTKVTPYEVMFKEGERIAQLVFTKWLASDDVVETERDGGLGSTGTK